MIKKSLFVASLLLTTTYTFAKDYFVGIDDINTLLTYKSWDNTTYSIRSVNLNFKAGFNNILNGRIYLKTGYLLRRKDDNGYKYRYFNKSINYDYYILKKDIYTPFVGLGVGLDKLNIKKMNKDTGVNYSFKFGSLVDIKKNTTLEFGTFYTKYNTSITRTVNNKTEIYKPRHSTALYFGFNYTY
jgi:hypothetical protein